MLAVDMFPAVMEESTGAKRPGSLTRLPAFHAPGFLAGERFERAAADVEREFPHRVSLLRTGLGELLQLVAGIAGEPAARVRILERRSHSDERRGDHVRDDRIFGKSLKSLRRLRRCRPGRLLLALLTLLVVRFFLLVLRH